MTLIPLRVAAVQAVSVAGDIDANVASAVEWVRRGADEGAELVVLPELFLPGYDYETQRAHPDECDVTPDDQRLEPLRKAAGDAAILVGAAVRRPDQRRTLSILSIDRSGTVTVAYSKQHLWSEEKGIFVAGSAGGSACIGDWELGLGICYDGCFPEHARAASDTGALAYVCPSAYVVGSEHRRDLYYAARALDNGIYVVFSGLVGRCGSMDFSGGTAIYDPQGRPVARVESGEGLAVADLDPEEIAEARQINPYPRDRLSNLGGRLWTTLEGSEAGAPAGGR